MYVFECISFFLSTRDFQYFWERWWPESLSFIHLCALDTSVMPEAKQMLDKAIVDEWKQLFILPSLEAGLSA